ncbi:MAG: hypothetical protein KJP21_02940, partial [Bacteroidia bacterium]|nr:hypothetical protein [Bacteroidia bacterium]
ELSYLEKSNGVAGLGLDLDLFLGFNVNSSSSILIELTNVQPAYLLSRNEINIDTSFRFEGIEFNPFSTDSSQSFDNFVDSNLNQVTRNYKNRTFALLPSNLRFSWTKLLNLKNRVSVQLSTTQFGKYGYRASLSHGYLFGPKFKIRSTVAFGNYSSFQWNEAIEYRANEKVNLFASAVGLNAMLSPNLSHSYGISIGISNCF